MNELAKAVGKAIRDYDRAMDRQDATAEDQEVAAHECVNLIREAWERSVRGEPATVNLNNPIAKLQERAQARGAPLPVYEFTQSGESHMPTFVCVCEAEGYVEEADGSSKQQAKRRAALAVLKTIHGMKDPE